MITIYEYFNNYTIKEVDDVIASLSLEERMIIRDKFGDDFFNPTDTGRWDDDKCFTYYSVILPKMKRLLALNKSKVVNAKEELSSTIEGEDLQSNVLTSKEINFPDECISNSLLQLLDIGKTSDEICELLYISPNRLYEELLKLKNKGLIYSRDYYYNGSILYKKVREFKDYRTFKYYNQDRTIITNGYDNNMKFLLFSDLHLGNSLERLDLGNRAFDYCIRNGINIILCGGDFIDGTFTREVQTISNPIKQIEHLINDYPYDRNIITFGVGGNHDLSVLNSLGIDIAEVCDNYRHDIVIGSYNNLRINVKNDSILLFHHIEGGIFRYRDESIVLHGHSHKYSTKLIDNSLDIALPTLTEMNGAVPSVVELDLSFDKGYIVNAGVKHIYFGDKDIVLSEFDYDLKERKFINEAVKNVGYIWSKDDKQYDNDKLASLVKDFNKSRRL